MDQDKPSARARLHARLRATAAEERAAWSAALRGHLLAWPRWQKAGTVMVFAALHYEPDLVPLLEAGPRLVFPSMEEDRIVPRLVCGAGDLVMSAQGIREPDVSRCEVVAAESLDLVLVPGLGFGRDGMRLGRGRGHYDRFLSGLPARTLRAGVGFHCQVSDSLPWEPHDAAMQALVTERGIVDCGMDSRLPGKNSGA